MIKANVLVASNTHIRNCYISTRNGDTYVFRNLRIKKSFKNAGSKTEVLKGISFSVEKGEICTLLGPSGSGKSTLLSILINLVLISQNPKDTDGHSSKECGIGLLPIPPPTVRTLRREEKALNESQEAPPP